SSAPPSDLRAATRLHKAAARICHNVPQLIIFRTGRSAAVPLRRTWCGQSVHWHGVCYGSRDTVRRGGENMSSFDNPYDHRSPTTACSCGGHRSPHEHDAAARAEARKVADSAERRVARVVEAGLMRALFPQAAGRRAFLKAVGGSTAAAALAHFLPLDLIGEALAEAKPLEKTKLSVGFIPITCATPIIMAKPMGFYERHGLDVEVVKTAGWAVVRDKTLNGEYDAAHMLSPMPIAITMGAGSNPIPYTMPAVENINGQAITLALRHKERRDPKDWKGFKFAVPFEFSMHNYLLRYYLAEAGIDPDRDVQIRVVPPPEMVANLRADNLD